MQAAVDHSPLRPSDEARPVLAMTNGTTDFWFFEDPDRLEFEVVHVP